MAIYKTCRSARVFFGPRNINANSEHVRVHLLIAIGYEQVNKYSTLKNIGV